MSRIPHFRRKSLVQNPRLPERLELFPGLVLGCSGMYLDVLERTGVSVTSVQSIGYLGNPWDVPGCTGMYRDELGCTGMY